jgi:hypothetical protein
MAVQPAASRYIDCTILTPDFSGGTKENNEKSVRTVGVLAGTRVTSQTRVRSVTTLPACSLSALL